MELLYEAELNAAQSERVSIAEEWSAVAIATTSTTSLLVVGEAVSVSGPNGGIETGRVTLSIQKAQLLRLPELGYPNAVELHLSDWIRHPAIVQIQGVVRRDQDDVGGDGDNETDGESRNLLELLPLPSTDGTVVAPGMAVFTAGEAVFQLPSSNQPDYHQQYSVSSEVFWKVGARSSEPFSSGRVRFGSGSGRSVLGLAPEFTTVDFRLVPWSWYVHSQSEVRPMDRVNGTVRSKGAFDWSPNKALALRVEGGRVVYEIQDGEGWNAVYESPHLVTEPLFFCVVLGPQAFVFNCSIS